MTFTFETFDKSMLICAGGFVSALVLTFWLVIQVGSRRLRLPGRRFGIAFVLLCMVLAFTYGFGIHRAWSLGPENAGKSVLLLGYVSQVIKEEGDSPRTAVMLADPTGQLAIIFHQISPPLDDHLCLVHGIYEQGEDGTGYLRADWRLNSIW